MPDFYIGRPTNGFLYSPSNLNVNGKTIYRCRRGSDTRDNQNIYFLFTDREGHLVAVEDDANSQNPVSTGREQFRSITPIPNVEQDGMQIQWHQWDEGQWQWPQYHGVTFASTYAKGKGKGK